MAPASAGLPPAASRPASPVGAAASRLSARFVSAGGGHHAGLPRTAAQAQAVLGLRNSALLFRGEGSRLSFLREVLTEALILLFEFQVQQQPSPQPMFSHFRTGSLLAPAARVAGPGRASRSYLLGTPREPLCSPSPVFSPDEPSLGPPPPRVPIPAFARGAAPACVLCGHLVDQQLCFDRSTPDLPQVSAERITCVLLLCSVPGGLRPAAVLACH